MLRRLPAARVSQVRAGGAQKPQDSEFGRSRQRSQRPAERGPAPLGRGGLRPDREGGGGEDAAAGSAGQEGSSEDRHREQARFCW